MAVLKGPDSIACDVLVIGSGGAGLRAAIQAREGGAGVILASKSLVGLGSNTAMSRAAFAAVLSRPGQEDTTESHLGDTLEAGRLINDRRLVDKVVSRIEDEVPFLEKCGVVFQRTEAGLVTGRVPGHRYDRNIYVVSNLGTRLTLPLKEYAARIGVRFMERVCITRLLERHGRAVGATGVDSSGGLIVFAARATVLATGGYCRTYRHTNNAAGTTGDGCALAFRLGVPLRDMEFVQFYPTTVGGANNLSYEAFTVRANGVLRNSLGEDILARHGLKGPGLTRDRLTRAITRENLAGNQVIMDLSPVPEATIERERSWMPAGTPRGKKVFIVSPAAHFAMGGVVTDAEARTPLPGLLACGEVVGGTHGANRLAGNAISEVLAMGAVAGESAAGAASGASPTPPDAADVTAEKERLESLFGEGKEDVRDLARALHDTTWDKVGTIRHQPGLEAAIKAIAEIRCRADDLRAADSKGLTRCLELDNMLLVADVVARAALDRTESRGAHYREDHPDEDPAWRLSLWAYHQQGSVTLQRKPV